MGNPCYCLELRTFLNSKNFLAHKQHQERCLACVNAIIEAKNDLVRDNFQLENQVNCLRETVEFSIAKAQQQELTTV